MATDGKKTISRRSALRRAGAVAAGVMILPRHLVAGAAAAAPSQRLNIAAVGIGGVAKGFIKQAAEQMNVLALCDVDSVYAAQVFDAYPGAKRFRDYREMFDTISDEIDAVLVGTPDHTHAIVTMEALRRKKHAVCVKSLTRSIHECRTVVAAAAKAGVATQVTASPNTNEEACRTCEYVWEGAIGDVREVHVWSNRPLWPQGMDRPEGADPIPDTLDWDLWLGPAPARAFKNTWPKNSYPLQQIQSRTGTEIKTTGVYHPWNFRGWWDFGTGALGDMGCHRFNTMFRALKLRYPTNIEATATKVHAETYPLGSIVTFDFPAREGMVPVRVVWYDGGLRPPRPRDFPGPLPSEGELYLGSKGTMFRSKILDSATAAKYKDLPKTLERRGGTFPEWFEAIAGGPPAGCPFDWAGLTTEAVLLGDIAAKLRRPLDWDGAAGRFVNDDEANRFIKTDYRDGWKL